MEQNQVGCMSRSDVFWVCRSYCIVGDVCRFSDNGQVSINVTIPARNVTVDISQYLHCMTPETANVIRLKDLCGIIVAIMLNLFSASRQHAYVCELRNMKSNHLMCIYFLSDMCR